MTLEEKAKEYAHNNYEILIDTDDAFVTSEDYLEQGYLAGATENGIQWHKLSEKYPDVNKLVRVHLLSGMEHICETDLYYPTEDEIGFGKAIIQFYELNGDCVDDNDIIAWCEEPQFEE